MRTSLAITLIIITILSFPSWGLTVDDLIYRKGIAYEKFTDVPFTGEVEGQFQGAFKNGWREGEWKVKTKRGDMRRCRRCKRIRVCISDIRNRSRRH